MNFQLFLAFQGMFVKITRLEILIKIILYWTDQAEINHPLRASSTGKLIFRIESMGEEVFSHPHDFATLNRNYMAFGRP